MTCLRRMAFCVRVCVDAAPSVNSCPSSTSFSVYQCQMVRGLLKTREKREHESVRASVKCSLTLSRHVRSLSSSSPSASFFLSPLSSHDDDGSKCERD